MVHNNVNPTLKIRAMSKQRKLRRQGGGVEEEDKVPNKTQSSELPSWPAH